MRKVLISLFSLVFVFCLTILLGSKVKATVVTDSNLTIEGASIRTSGNQGMRFTGNIGSYSGSVSKYGICLVPGDAVVDENFVIGGTVDGNSVINAEVNELDFEDKFHVVLWNIPEEAYTMDVSARAYVRLTDDSIVYGTAKAVRCLAEVAFKALNDNYSSDLLTEVKTYISANYKQAYTNYENGYAVNNAAYCYDPTELGQLFVRDYNKFVDAEDRIDSITSYSKAAGKSLGYGTGSKTGADFYYSAKKSKWTNINSGAESSVTNLSESNLYGFFNDAVYGAKWGWLLNLIRTADGDSANASWQAQAIQGDGTNGGKQLYSGQHLILSIIAFFTKQKLTYYYSGVDFTLASKQALYEGMFTGTYANTTVYNSYLREHELYEVGDTLTLPAARTPATGYSWDAYEMNSTKYAAGSSYTVTSANVHFTPKFTLNNYSISYYDGETPIVLSPSTYTVLTDTFALPNYEKDSYTFDGWYTNSLFEGSAVTEVTKGSHENKTFYAKTTYTPYATVNLTFDLNGGAWALEDILSQNTPTKTIVATYYNAYQPSGYDISFVTSLSQSIYWNYIVLEKTAFPNVYRIIGKANGSANLPIVYDAVISYHSSCTSEYFQAVKDIYNGSNIGQYITAENVPATSGGSKSITLKLYPSTVLSASYIKNANAPEELPTPNREFYTFNGWTNSYSSATETTFPGYPSNPGDITYTAQWTAVTPVNLALNADDERVFGLVTPDKYINPVFTSGTFNIGGNLYRVGYELFPDFPSAMRKTNSGEVVYAFAGTYSDGFNIRASNIKLIGPNYNLPGDSASRGTEAQITGGITIAKQLSSVEINGLHFNGTSAIVNTKGAKGSAASPATNLNGFKFNYNKVTSHLTSGTGFLTFTEAASSYSHDLEFKYNLFDGTDENTDAVLSLNNNVGLTIESSKFVNITGHAVYVDDASKGAAGNVTIKDNTFKDITGSAFFADWYSPLPDTTPSILIQNNIFDNVAGSACVDFEQCNAGDTYASFIIELNVFKSVKKGFYGYASQQSGSSYGYIFRDNVVYKYASHIYVARCGSEAYRVDCARNLYLSEDGSEIYTNPTTSGFAFHGGTVTTENMNTNNYASIDAYNTATGQSFSN